MEPKVTYFHLLVDMHLTAINIISRLKSDKMQS